MFSLLHLPSLHYPLSFLWGIFFGGGNAMDYLYFVRHLHSFVVLHGILWFLVGKFLLTQNTEMASQRPIEARTFDASSHDQNVPFFHL